MPSLVIVEQLRPSAELASPLQDDTAIVLQWSVQDEHSRPVQSQSCSLTFSAGAPLVVEVPASDRRCSFRLGKGTRVTLPLRAEVTVNLGARNPHAAAPLSGTVETRVKSTNDPDSDASKTVYGELNQELRRSRTLYETFLVVVTGALATVFSKRSDIAGAHRPSIIVGLVALALIVIYMIWQVAERYRKIVASLNDFERSWGLRSGPVPDFLMQEESAQGWKFWTKRWWCMLYDTQIKNGSWRHTFWALGLTVYAMVAIGIVIVFLYASPSDSAKTVAPATNATRTCPVPNLPSSTNAPSGVTTPEKPANAGGQKQKKQSGA